MGFTANEIILMYYAVQSFKDNLYEELDNECNSVKEHNETLNTIKICNALLRKLKKTANENNIPLED